VSISLTVLEKIDFEENHLAPSSDKTGSGRGPIMWGSEEVVGAYNSCELH